MNVSTKKPYCKVCRDAGKPESEYTSHWVKDLTGKTTCPTLLDTECRYCHGLGHTAKFCDILAKNNKEKEKAERRSQAVAKEQPKLVIKKKPTNGFAALCDDSDEDIQEFPALNVVKEEKALTGWAAVAAKPKEEKVVEKLPALAPGMVVLTSKAKREREIAVETKPVVAPKPAPWATKEPVQTKRWADYSDSEDDDDEVCNDAWD